MAGSYYSDVERTIFLTYVILMEDVLKYDELFHSERKFITFEYWKEHFLHHLDFDDLVYGHEKLSEIVSKHPMTRDGLNRYLFEVILRRMEIRDKSRSVSSIDVVFNFDCLGFTGTPFLDNYPTFAYIRDGRNDDLPNLIDRSFYAYSSESLQQDEFQRRFARFQSKNNDVSVEYVSSDFIRDSSDEMAILGSIFAREAREAVSTPNVIVDLCGIVKKATIHDIRNLLVKHFGNTFAFIYHIDPVSNSDRVLSVASENDQLFDTEFYKHACRAHGKDLRDRIFFFVDNRNVIGRDIPFQLVFQKHYGHPLFTKSVILAHDVDDFSKIWQAMGRSRTMNDTVFSIYKSGVPDSVSSTEVTGPQDIKLHPLTQQLYVHNCDSKMAGNISSIYLTLVALLNLSEKSFYFRDEIVNVFLEKMEKTIEQSVAKHELQLVRKVLGNPLPAQMLGHIVMDKFQRSSDPAVTAIDMNVVNLEQLLRHIVQQKFEQRAPSNDVFDNLILFLSGEQKSQMEISYSKQQQKQKQKQQNKNQDSDAMGVFDKKNQLLLSYRVDDYFDETLRPLEDIAKIVLNLPLSVPILRLTYNLDGRPCPIQVYPTVQFLYSHNIQSGYLTKEVQSMVRSFKDSSTFYARFFHDVGRSPKGEDGASPAAIHASSGDISGLSIKIECNAIRQNPQYSLAGLRPGVYVIGMKDQFNSHDMKSNPLHDHIKYISDEMGFILFDKTKSKRLDTFGPYYIEQYILMEVLSKQEVAQNVMDYFCSNRDLLQSGLDSYDEQQGQGFICWRFLINEAAKAAAAQTMSTD